MINWYLKKFDELLPFELYAILQLRNEIFVVEQNSVYQDCDNKDQPSYHLMGWQQNILVAYSRLIPAGIAYNEPSIGRVGTAITVRGKNIGRELMTLSIRHIHQLFGDCSITISAQLYLKKFYESLGFTASGDIYLEDHIEHIKMHLSRNYFAQ
jgi:ElaA protein